MHTTVTQAPAFPSPRSHDPFETGLRHGWMTGEHVSNRQVAEQYPDWSIGQAELYQNGRDDGVAGDFWRFKRRHAALREAA